MKLDPVRYDDRPIGDLFPELVAAAGRSLEQFMAKVREPEMGVQEFLIGSTLLKEAQYRPEREVRIVGIPGTAGMTEIALRDHPYAFKKLPLPVVHRRDDGRRYVSVFEGKPISLPITRIIVGPAAGQAGIDLARSLVGDVPVTVSRSAQPPA